MNCTSQHVEYIYIYIEQNHNNDNNNRTKLYHGREQVSSQSVYMKIMQL